MTPSKPSAKRGKCYLTKREIAVVDLFKSGECIEDLMWEESVITRYTIENILRKALIHQRVTPSGKVYYDKPLPRPHRKEKRRG